MLLGGVARAAIVPPTTLDGPSSAIGEFGGAAVSEDGSGGVVYTKQVEGVQHVFAAQYVDGGWRPPVRVDWQSPFGAQSPRVAAADGGWLVVVWVSQIATVKGRGQDALYSSTLQPGASSFGEQFTVDPDVGEGLGVDPSLALAASGQGVVAYRAVTDNYSTSDVTTTIRPLRPGDVLADIRVARYEGQLWSAPQRVNRNPLLSMRPPTETNGPRVGIGRGDQAVVAWQEPEPGGVARIWLRRVFPSTLGLALPASPGSYGGQPVTGDADALALSVSEFGEAKVVSRIAGTPSSALGGTRLFVDTLPVSTSPKGGQLSGAVIADGGGASAPPAAGVGPPSVSVDDEGSFRIAFASGRSTDVLVGDERHQVAPEATIGAAVAGSSSGAVTVLNPAGGGVTAWPASNSGGLLGVALREDYPDGAAQSALISGAIAGPVSGLAAAGSESGESLVAFRQGGPGAYEIVGARVSVPPPQFFLELPTSWVTPARARISWSHAEDATGGVSYALVLDGRVVRRGIRSLSVLPDRRLLGSGVRHVQILATDAAGQQTLSGEGGLKVDGRPPLASIRHRGRTVTVTVRDAQSGALARGTLIAFGDGAHARGRLRARHTYARPGRYVIAVQMRDRVGNRETAHLRVMVR